MRRTHYISGMIITLFIGLHLFNHFMSIYGIHTHIEVMAKLRLVYRNPFAECLLLAVVMIQIITGVRLYLMYRSKSRFSFHRLHLLSGLYLAVFLVIHVTAILVGRIILHLDTNVYFGAAGINYFPFNLFFIPYYGLAIMSFFGHLSAIHFKRCNKSVLGITPKIQSYVLITLGAMITASIFYGLTDGLHGITIPQEYKILVGQ